MSEDDFRYKVTFEDELSRHDVFVYTNKGTSMMPLLRENRDLMVIRKKEEGRCKKYDVVLYRYPNSEKYILHRILKVRKEDYVLCGDHCIKTEAGITDEQIIGIMTAVIRNNKEIQVTDLLYRLYVHLWCDFFPIRVMLLKGIKIAKYYFAKYVKKYEKASGK